MIQYIDKAAVVAEIERRIKKVSQIKKASYEIGLCDAYKIILSFLDTLEVRDPYERCVQYQSVEDGIKAHAEIYSFNTNSELFPQLTKEQQKLWRKEIEYACISGGDAGYLLAKDPRYKENHEVKEVDLEEYINELSKQFPEVSFAKLSRIAVRVAKWQKQQDQSTIELAEDHAYFAGRTKTTDEIKEALLSEVLPYFMHGREADEVVAKLDEVLNQKK